MGHVIRKDQNIDIKQTKYHQGRDVGAADVAIEY
jgi:hypothetical protein